MDDLEFRRAIYADPASQDADLLAAAKSDTAKQHFWQDMKLFDAQIHDTLNMPAVPDGLADRLILRQTITRHRTIQKRQRWYLGLAASLLLCSWIGFALWQSPAVNLGSYALAHREFEGELPMQMDENINLNQLNVKLAGFGGQLKHSPGKVYFANFCDFDNLRSLHLVIGSKQGKVTVFILPMPKDSTLPSQFADKQFSGTATQVGHFAILAVGSAQQATQQTLEKISQSLQFST